MFAVPQDQVRRVHASSGTTGRPTVVGYTERDLDTWATVMSRSIRAAGGRPGDKLHNAYGYGLLTGDRKSVVEGKSVDLGGRRIIKNTHPAFTERVLSLS